MECKTPKIWDLPQKFLMSELEAPPQMHVGPHWQPQCGGAALGGVERPWWGGAALCGGVALVA